LAKKESVGFFYESFFNNRETGSKKCILISEVIIKEKKVCLFKISTEECA